MIDRCAFSVSTRTLNGVNQFLYYKWHKIKIMDRFILVFAQCSLQGKIGRQSDLGPMRLVLNTVRHWLFFLRASEVQNLRLIHATHINLIASCLSLLSKNFNGTCAFGSENTWCQTIFPRLPHSNIGRQNDELLV